MTRPINTPDEPVLLYEVIRICDGIPLFLEDHLKRLQESARLMGITRLPAQDALSELIMQYLSFQKRDTGNIKLTCLFRTPLSESTSELNFIPHQYPTTAEYCDGVKVGLLPVERPVPNAKMHHSVIRDLANELLAKKDLFEVLLVDSNGNITEGSRSNVFFVRGNTLYSAPGAKILKGITWLKIMQLCKKEEIRVIETAVHVNNLDQYEAGFLTGTSPKVLPISAVEQFVFKTDHPLLIRLQNLYDQLIKDYLAMGS
jgi:branched-chain amino acid aminotransferase